MAKKDKAPKADTKGSKTKASKDDEDEAPAKTEFKFGVDDLADELGIKPASVRVQLRNKGIEKAGKSYGWNTKAELKEVVAQLKAEAEDDEDEKPKGKKSKSKDADEKPAKKGKSKKAADDDGDDDEDEKPVKKSKKSKKSKGDDE